MVHEHKVQPEACRVLIVDDHPVVRYGLSQAIAQHPDLIVCGEASTVAEALTLVDSESPDVAVVDISLEDESGLRLIDQIANRYPHTRTLVSSIHEAEVYAPRALQAGALGYIEKGETIETVVDAIRQVHRGELYLSRHMSQQLLRRAATGSPLSREPTTMLSNRELEVFEMIGRGMTVNQIAGKLRLSPKTIESHRKNIKDKLNLRNSAQLSRCAYDWVREQH